MLCDQASEEKWSLRQQAVELLLQVLSSDEIRIRRNVLNPEKQLHANANFLHEKITSNPYLKDLQL